MILTVFNRTTTFYTSAKWGTFGTETSYLMLALILISGNTYQKTSTIFGIMGIGLESESKFCKSVLPEMERAVQKITDQFIIQCRIKTPSKSDVHVMIDAGWNHPGWWAREATITALDGKTSLPIGLFHVIKGKNGNFSGSSRGFRFM